jgi:hypothetical protein
MEEVFGSSLGSGIVEAFRELETTRTRPIQHTRSGEFLS